MSEFLSFVSFFFAFPRIGESVVVPFVICCLSCIISSLFVCAPIFSVRRKMKLYCVLAVSFLVISVYLSLRFPEFMSEGRRFREIIPFLDVTFY